MPCEKFKLKQKCICLQFFEKCAVIDLVLKYWKQMYQNISEVPQCSDILSGFYSAVTIFSIF